jgi:hypothetical protein
MNRRCFPCFVPVACAAVTILSGAAIVTTPVAAHAQDGGNKRAQEDINAFLQKAEEGDRLFDQKKYAEAAAALAAAHSLYQRAERRDEDSTGNKVSLKPQTFKALRFYGYGMGENASLSEEPTGAITGTAAGLHTAVTEMWMDAAILGGADKVPRAGAFSDPPLVELTDEEFESILGGICGPVGRYELPVPDDEWQKVVLTSRRAQLLVEYALQKHPDWKDGKHGWMSVKGDLEPPGDVILADIKAKRAEAEPEYQKVAADARKADPPGIGTFLDVRMEKLNGALADVKSNGWLDWSLARDLFITKDYLSGLRAGLNKAYAAEGKTMPADRLKPVEDRIAQITAAAEAGAARWRFPAGKPRNAAIEARSAAAVKAKFPGATILKTALDGTDWRIATNDLGLPRYRTRNVLVLAQIPGQKRPWLILGSYDQAYAGGGTYNSGGTFYFSQARIQGAQ